MEEALLAQVDPVPRYTARPDPPPPYTSSPAGLQTVESVALDPFLTLELLSLIVRCMKVVLKITKPTSDDRAWYEKLLRIPGVLDNYLSSVIVTAEAKKGPKMMVKLARQCTYDIRQFGRRVERIARMPLDGTRIESREFDEMEQEWTRFQAKLQDVVLTVLREEYLRQLCSYEESLDLTTRTHLGSIGEINPYLHRLISLLSTLPTFTHPVRRAMFAVLDQKFDDEIEEGFFEAISKPTFSDLRGRILQSLRYPNQNSPFELISEPSPGTCKWIFDATIANAKESFGTWLKANLDTGLDRHFWISGDPGTGKSVLIKYLVMEAQRNPAILKGPEDEEIPVVLSHFFNHEGDLIHRTTRGMILNLLFQLFEQDPGLLDGHFHHCMVDVTEYHNMRKTSAEWKDHTLWDLLKRVLGDIKERKKRLFIFIDGPSGFDMKTLGPANPERGHNHPRHGSIHSLIDCEPYHKPQPTQLIYFLSHYTKANIIVAARPEGAFHKMYWKSQLHLKPALLRPAIKAFCHTSLGHLWLMQRHSFTRKILSKPASNSSFTEALDALDKIKRQTSGYIIAELPPPLRRSEVLYTSFIARFYESHSKVEMESLSRILNLILPYRSHRVSSLRSNTHPFSLLQLTLCLKDSLVNHCLRKGAFDAPPDIRDICKEVAKMIKERLYPFITLRKMDNPPCRFDKGAKGMDSMESVQEVATEVCFLRPSLAEFLTGTAQGRELMSLDEVNPPQLADLAVRRA